MNNAGFTIIHDNELEWMLQNLSGNELKIALVLFKETRGWNRTETCELPHSVIARRTGINERNISRTMKNLEKIKFSRETKKGSRGHGGRFEVPMASKMPRQNDVETKTTAINPRQNDGESLQSHVKLTSNRPNTTSIYPPFNKENLNKGSKEGPAYKSPIQNIGTIQNQRQRNEAEAAWASTTMRSAGEAIRLWKAGKFSNVRRACG